MPVGSIQRTDLQLRLFVVKKYLLSQRTTFSQAHSRVSGYFMQKRAQNSPDVYINCWGSPRFPFRRLTNCRSCYGSRSETAKFGGAQKAGQPQLLEHAFSFTRHEKRWSSPQLGGSLREVKHRVNAVNVCHFHGLFGFTTSEVKNKISCP